MKNEKMLELINEFNATGDYSIITKLEETLKADIKEDIRKKEVKKTGNVKIDSVLKKMYKSLNSKTMHQPDLQGYSKVGDKYMFTDCYRLVVVNSDYGYEQMNQKTDFSYYMNLNNEYKDYKIDISDLEYHVKMCKALTKGDPKKKNALYEIPNTETCINGYWLLEMLKVMNTNKVKILNPLAPVYIGDTKNEFGMILPIRK